MAHKRVRRMALSLVAMVSVVFGSTLTVSPSAHADTTYWPPSGSNNHFRVYLSRACHGASGSSNCVTNVGCDGYSENNRSRLIAKKAKDDLLARGFPVRIGNGGVNANISSSNSWHSDLHVPIHSNARSEGCGNTNKGNHGFWGLYRYSGEKQIAKLGRDHIGSNGPGTDDKIVYRTDLAEINNVNTKTLYLENEFHTWNMGVNWLRNSSSWVWRIGWTIDDCQGYPNSNGNPTLPKKCTW